LSRALVVDKSREDRERIRAILEARGLDVSCAASDEEALAAITPVLPDVIIADGLELVEAVHLRHLGVPVIVLTDDPNALLKGAASFVPKGSEPEDLCETVERVIEITRTQQQDEPTPCVEETEYRFVIDNDANHFRPVIGFLRSQLARYALGDETVLMQIAIALDEALANAAHHGNLEVSSRLRDENIDEYFRQVAARLDKAPYKDRRIEITTRMSAVGATFVVRDEGRGFDPAAIPDPTIAENLRKNSGRGLLLIGTIMDEVRHNDRGNEITMVKRAI